jgi:hypothetical protein
MARRTSSLSEPQVSSLHEGANWSHDRTFVPNHEQAAVVSGGLPKELAFLAGEGFSPELLVEAVRATPTAVLPSIGY